MQVLIFCHLGLKTPIRGAKIRVWGFDPKMGSSLIATSVEWGTAVSEFFPLSCGVRQGGVLSPYLFSVYIDGVVDRVR